MLLYTLTKKKKKKERLINTELNLNRRYAYNEKTS